MTVVDPIGSTVERRVGAPPGTDLHECLDAAVADLVGDRVLAGMARLFADLRGLRQRLNPKEWRAAVSICRSHPLSDLLCEDPVTARSLARPRGYPGDADLLDLIYGHGPVPATTERGAAVYRFNVMSPAAQAVRTRRRIAAEAVMRTAALRNDTRVLSVAAGHLREYHDVTPWAMDRVAQWVAIDRDPDCLAEIARTTDRALVTARALDVAATGDDLADLGAFDLIYSTGLYDYFGDRKARDLTARLFALLAPGGRLLIANFLPDIHGVGYMEAYLDWWLQYRTLAALESVTDELLLRGVGDMHVRVGPHRNVAYLTVQRCGLRGPVT